MAGAPAGRAVPGLAPAAGCCSLSAPRPSSYQWPWRSPPRARQGPRWALSSSVWRRHTRCATRSTPCRRQKLPLRSLLSNGGPCPRPARTRSTTSSCSTWRTRHSCARSAAKTCRASMAWVVPARGPPPPRFFHAPARPTTGRQSHPRHPPPPAKP
jgi:hypothetical protein